MARLAAILWCLVCVALMALVALLASCRDGLSARRQPSESASAARPRSSAPPATPTSVAAGFTVVAGGLVNPRGLAFAADGALYVAEAGVGGPTEIDLGRKRSHLVGNTGRVSMVRPGQSPRPLLSELPSIVTAAREEVGPTGLTFVGDTLYLLTASGGWDVGDPAFDNRLYRVAAEGALQPVLNLSELNLSEPSLARRQDPRADVPGGMPYGLVSLGGALYATDGNQDQVIKITPDGRAHRILEYPASDRALTGIATGPDDSLYVAEYAAGQISRVGPEGGSAMVATGLALPIGLAFDPSGRLCVLEYVGQLVCLAGDGSRDVIASGLSQPTAVALGPDGSFYVSNHGHFAPDGQGQIVRVDARR